MLSFLYVYSDHSILECYNLFSGVELSMRSFFVITNEGGSRMWRKPLATDEGVRFIILAARETNTIEYELEFYYDMSRQGYIRL